MSGSGTQPLSLSDGEYKRALFLGPCTGSRGCHPEGQGAFKDGCGKSKASYTGEKGENRAKGNSSYYWWGYIGDYSGTGMLKTGL